jgi:hypothetical protein
VEPIRLQKIDESLLSQHSCIELTDCCYFIGEYASGCGFEHSKMNDVINNFKKPMNRKERPEWRFKEKAISTIAHWIVSTTSWNKLKSGTWVPMPPSKIKSDPHYDGRLCEVLLEMQKMAGSIDIRELLAAKTSREAAHKPGAIRPGMQDHLNNFILDELQKNPRPRWIILFDDIITSGAHFKAAQTIIQKKFSKLPIIGLFVARSVKVNGDQS